MTDQSPVEQVRAGIDIVDLVSQYVTLKKAGRTFKGLCPFHTEKTPSLVVFPDTGRWHCFGCGEGGDLFTFLMKTHNLTFAEALRQLADRIGVVVTRGEDARNRDERRRAHQRLHAANEAAAIFYHGLLLNAAPARAYVARRGITDDSLREFLLGLAPDSFDALQRHLIAQGFTRDELLAAGLLYQPEDGPARDRYHGRLIFPIRDAEGHIVSFGARALASDAQPKYLNGPQTDIFDKSSTLYGLFEGAQAIRREKRAVVVEGYVDVVVAQQAGFRNVVATLGTSITERHLRQLARLAPEICLALDPDTAGETAALRSAEVARGALADAALPIPTWRGLVRYEAAARATVLIAALPDGKDPDELVLESPDRWRATVAAARPVLDFALDWVVGRYDLTTARGKAEAAATLVPLLRDIADPIQRSHYVEVAAERLHVDTPALLERVRQQVPPRLRRPGRGPSEAPPPPASAAVRSQPCSDQEYAIALWAAAVERGMAPGALDPTDFADALLRALVERCQTVWLHEARADWRPDLLALVDEDWLAGAVGRVRALRDDVERLSDAQLATEAERVARQLRAARIDLEINAFLLSLAEAEPEDTSSIRAAIAERIAQRTELLKVEPAARGSASGLGTRVAIIPARFRLAVHALPGD